MEEERKFVMSLKPIKRLVPGGPPYMACKEFLLSKKFTSELPRHIKFEPLCERNVKLGHHFIQKQYKMVEDNLEATRLKAEKERKSLDQQWLDLDNKEKDLREAFIKFNQFMEENKQKKERSIKKIDEMNILLEKRNKELEKLNKECVQMKEMKAILDEDIKKYIIFEKFLMDVVNYGKFESINSILSRYLALIQARKDLMALYEKSITELFKTQKEIKTLIMNKFVQINGLSNTLTGIQERYEKVKIKHEQAEKFRNDSVLAAMQQILDIQYTRDSCREIYEHICKRRNTKPIYINNYEKQLEVIKRTLLRMRLVNRMVEAINDDNWSPPTETESISDSIVANVVRRFLSKNKNNVINMKKE